MAKFKNAPHGMTEEEWEETQRANLEWDKRRRPLYYALKGIALIDAHRLGKLFERGISAKSASATPQWMRMRLHIVAEKYLSKRSVR